jgi:ABC-2 type transport system permease protein
MKMLTIFLYEFKHFKRAKAKTFAFLLFVLAVFYSLYNGFNLQNKQLNTLTIVEKESQESIGKTLKWFEEEKKGPEDRPWIDITQPFWALLNTSTYTIKTPSSLLPLGIGQSEQYGFYKGITNWSSTFDNDMVEELSNPERLVNGNIDFSFLLIFLLPILLIILTYNIHGLEKDLGLDKLVVIQSSSIKKWIFARLVFYSSILILTITLLILLVAFFNNAFISQTVNVLQLIVLSIIYILIWSLIFFFVILKSKSSSAIAFKMISVWLLFCVIIPGMVHQLASIYYPVNYMTDYLDANRKEAYEVYDLSTGSLSKKLFKIYPDLKNTTIGKDSIIDEEAVNEAVCAIINEMNKEAITKIEKNNDIKNNFISSSYWFNPVVCFQNKWNEITETDYSSYKNFRKKVQCKIDQKIKLLVFDSWNRKNVTKKMYLDYLKVLNER